jgi:CRISPR type III-A-associated RAMP protein Csm4
MTSGFIVRFRPVGPWRLGPSSGARDRVDGVLHSDTLFSALTIAADKLGFIAEWLAATAEAAEPAVRIGSGFPFIGRTLLAPAPKHVWPPVIASKIRWQAAKLVPLQVIPRLLSYESLKEDRWAVDPASESVLPVEKFGEVSPPFRVRMRQTAAVDRLSNVSTEAVTTACLEFADTAGMWCPVFCAPEWRDRVQALFRFVADAGIGGERSSGWGRSDTPEFEPLPSWLTAAPAELDQHETGYWLLSMFAPANSDRVDWSRGSYSLLRRSGRTEGRGDVKIESAMVEEGSVLISEDLPSGLARNIAPDGYAHPVYRAGFAFAVPVSVRLPGFVAFQRVVESEPQPVPIQPAVVTAAIPEPESFAEEPPTEPERLPEPQPGAEAGALEDSPAIPHVPDAEMFVVETEPSSEPQPVPVEPAAVTSANREPESFAEAQPLAEESPTEPERLPEPEPDALEDSPAVPDVPDAEMFVVETEPIIEHPEYGEADGGSLEDGTAEPDFPEPSTPPAPAADEKPEEER